MINKKIVVVILLGLFVVGGFGMWFFFGNNDSGITGNVVATVNGEKITSKEIAAVQQLFMQRGQQISAEDASEQLINKKVLFQQAQQGKYSVTDDEAEAVIEAQLAQQGSSLDDYKQQLELQGISYEEQLQDIKEDLTIQKYLGIALEGKDFEVTEEEAQKFYEMYKLQSPDEVPSYEELESKIIATLQQQKQQEAIGSLIQELRASADIEYLQSSNTNQQQGESYEEMTARMHPSQQNNDDMSSHHGGSVQTSNDKTNLEMDKISFSSAIGQIAPDFTLTKQDGLKFTLSDYKDKTVVLFFNEGAMCYPACWDQMASLGVDERFNNDNIITASIVIDGKEKWNQILSSQPKYGSGAILFDAGAAVSRAYDVLNLPSSMHKGSFPGHTYVIIKNGVISYVLDDPNMALNNDKLALKIM